MKYIAITAKGTKLPVKITDDSIKNWGMGHLGIALREKLLEAKGLAIGDPLKYRTDRTNLIKSTDQRIHENIQDYIATGIGDGAAKKYALELCKAVEQAEMNLINLLKKDRRK